MCTLTSVICLQYSVICLPSEALWAKGGPLPALRSLSGEAGSSVIVCLKLFMQRFAGDSETAGGFAFVAAASLHRF